MAMLEPWNDSSVCPPPVHTTTYDSDLDLKELTYTCNRIIKVLSKQSPLHRESAILSRFLYKFDKKFRNDIGYRKFKKVNTALRKYLILNLLKDVENFLSVLPSDNEDVYVPTRQMLEYILVRLITFSKITLRLCVCSKQAAIFYLDRVKRGESHWMSLMPYALLSRIWSMSMVLLQHSCQWYAKLYPFVDKLNLKGVDFLPAGYNLPIDLEEWLDLQNIDCFGKFEWAQKKQIEIDTGLVEDGEGDTFDSILDYVNQVNNDNPDEKFEVEAFREKLKDSEELHVSSIKSIDQGEVISRDSFKTLFSSFPGSIQKKVNHSVEKVTNKVSLLQFVTTEEKFRNENNMQALTSHLSFMQWHALKNALLKLHDSIAGNRKIERKFQKIWNDKCVDCS